MLLKGSTNHIVLQLNREEKMNSRLYFEGIAAALWGLPMITIGLVLATSSNGKVSEKANSPDLGASKPIEVQLPKMHESIKNQEATNPSLPPQNSFEPQSLDDLPLKNSVEQTIQRAEELNNLQRQVIIQRYRTAQREGKYQLEIARTVGNDLTRIGDFFLVRTERVARSFDKTGFPCQLSPSQQSGIGVRLEEYQLPVQVRDSIRTDTEIRNSLQTDYQLILNSIVEIELYRSLYTFVSQQNLPAPIPGHLYQASVTVANGSPTVVWNDLGQPTFEHR